MYACMRVCVCVCQLNMQVRACNFHGDNKSMSRYIRQRYFPMESDGEVEKFMAQKRE